MVHEEKPEYPKVQRFLTVGFNSTNRHLESLAMAPAMDKREDSGNENCSWMIAVFVARADQPSMLTAHFPLLIQTASLASPLKPPIRLVSLPNRADERLSTNMGLPRVGIIGLLDGAPGADGLVELVRRSVPGVEVPWLQEAAVGKYLPVSIKAIETSAPVAQKRRGPKSQNTDEPD